MVVPPNHSVLGTLSIINHPFWDTHIYGNPHIYNIYLYHDTREWNIRSPLYDSLYIDSHYDIIISIISHYLSFYPIYPIYDLSYLYLSNYIPLIYRV